MSNKRKWKALACELKDWGENVLVYHFPSGNTHLLNPTAALTLELIIKNPRTTWDLAQQLSSILELKFDQEVITHVQVILDNLDELGLIEPMGLAPS